MRRACVVAAVALVVHGCSSISRDGVDAWQDQIDFRNENIFLIGAVDMARASDFPNHVETVNDYEQLKCFEKAGYLRFVRDENVADGNFHGFNNMLGTVQRGIVRHINTELTPLGQDYRKTDRRFKLIQNYEADHPTLDIFSFHFRKSRVSKLVSNNVVENDAGKFRIIESEVVAERSDDARKYYDACPDSVTPGLKTVLHTRALVKWDAFSSSWKFIASDAVQSDQDLTNSTNVSTALKSS